MKSFFDKLNLRPGERRLVIIVALIVFLVVNAFMVWPRFLEWGTVTNREKAARDTRDQYQREVDNIKRYQLRLAELEQKGAQIGNEDQALKLSSTVYSQAALSGVTINGWSPQRASAGTGGKTNQFFDEQSGRITLAPTEEKALVDFLYNLGAGDSLIRVRSMTLSPDPSRQKLQGSIDLVASFARRPPPRVTPSAATPARTNAAASTTSAPRGSSPASRTAAPFGRSTNALPARNIPPPPTR